MHSTAVSQTPTVSCPRVSTNAHGIVERIDYAGSKSRALFYDTYGRLSAIFTAHDSQCDFGTTDNILTRGADDKWFIRNAATGAMNATCYGGKDAVVVDAEGTLLMTSAGKTHVFKADGTQLYIDWLANVVHQLVKEGGTCRWVRR